ncbi:FAD binding domain protein [Teladorsagia circumcincta]|uniref:FAD binding domain protein n=1 Tax=Teladorsagia circumcincta TaxID=45464 RepID=A0A2G9UUQ2_TELCI|nr:FAD binding domain protein [Teladorsagia circumcincta]
MNKLVFSSAHVPNLAPIDRPQRIPSPKEGRATPVGMGIINAAKQRVADIAKDRPDDVTILTNTRVLRFPTTNGAFARGDGVKMARAMGAEVVGMDRVQIHPTAFVDPADPSAGTKFLAAEALRGKGAILGGSAGLSAAIMLMNDDAADSFGRPAFNFYAIVKKFFMKYDSANELAAAMGISPNVLEKTLMDYNKYAKSSSGDAKEKDSFGKTVFPVAIEPDQPIYAAIITPAIHYTMGGLKIDKQARVYNEFMNQPFKGLLAAGEVTGGVHGANRLAGNSLLECVVFGRIAGGSAASINYSHEEL